MIALPLRHTDLIFSLISLCDYFLLLCALVSIIQKDIFSSSVRSPTKWFVAAFFSFNSNFILLLFCRIIGEGVQWPRFIPNYFTGSVPANQMGVYLCLLQFLLALFPHVHTLPSPQFLCNSIHFWFISLFYGCSWCSPRDPRAVAGFGTKEGWMKALPPTQMWPVTPASVTWEGTIKHKAGSRLKGLTVLWFSKLSCLGRV